MKRNCWMQWHIWHICWSLCLLTKFDAFFFFTSALLSHLKHLTSNNLHSICNLKKKKNEFAFSLILIIERTTWYMGTKNAGEIQSRINTSESLEPSKLLSLMLAEPIKVVQSSTIMILLCTYTCSTKKT